MGRRFFIQYSLRSLSSHTILRQLDDFELDIGFTYLDREVQAGFEVLRLYRERYVLMSRADAGGNASPNRWDAMEGLPLCLLNGTMQNRQVINAAFRRAGVQPAVIAEADSLLALLSTVQHVRVHSVLPHSLLGVVHDNSVFTPTLLKPELRREIVLITRNVPAMPPIVAAMWEAAQRLDLQRRFDALLEGAAGVL